MKKLFCLFCLLPFLCTAQNADSAWIVSNYIKQEVMIPMRDGIKLFTTIYIPNDRSEKHPIIMERTPYSCEPYGKNNYASLFNAYYSSFKEFAKEKYIIVTQDVRGRWMSEGEFVDIRPFNPNKKTNKDIDEASDTYDAIDWLVKNIENNNGSVGVMGISYPGFYSSMAALCGHPALKAVSPQAPVTDWFIGDDFHHNGAFFLMDAFNFYVGWGFGKPRPVPTTKYPEEFKYPINDNYEFYLRTGALPNFTKLTGDSILFWNDLMNHPNMNDWWKIRNIRTSLHNVKPAMLLVGGLFDAEDCFGAWSVYKAIEKQSPSTNNKIVMGPWYHGQWESKDGTHLGQINFGANTSEWYQQNIIAPFFNYYLKGRGNIDKIKEATIFFTGINEWKSLPQWPPANTDAAAMWLQKGNKLSFHQNKPASKTFDEYISDPAKPVPYADNIHFRRTREYMNDDQRFAARRTDVLVYQSDILQEDVTLAGPVVADLVVSLSGTDADFVVKLIDVFPDNFEPQKNALNESKDQLTMKGYQMLVRAEIMRGKYRNSFEKPEPFVPNKPTQVKYSMPDVAHTFKKGHRIMVQVQSSWFPLADRNPQQFMDIYHAKDSDFKKATIRIYHDQSKIMLPVVNGVLK